MGKIIIKRPGPGVMLTLARKANQIQCNFIFLGCAQHTLICFAKYSAKNVFMAKLLQNNSNLNDFEYSTHLKARKIYKRPKKILKAKKRPEVEKPKSS